MSFMKGAPGCCCCKNIYHGNAIIRMIAVDKDAPGASTRFQDYPSDANLSTLAWCIDHYHQLAFLMSWSPDTTSTARQVGSMAMKILPTRADNIITSVINFGSALNAERVCTASEDSKLYYVCSDQPLTTTYRFRECNFDGTGDIEAFTRTMAATGQGLVRRIEHCRYDDKLYYAARKSGDTYFKIYRCDRDGTNDALVYDVGGTNPTMTATRTPFCFDNVRGYLYVGKNTTGSPGKGEILRMNLDGTSPTTIYDTGTYTTPATSYGVHALRFSHKNDAVYWIEGSNIAATSDNSGEPTAGMWTCGHDGSNPTQLTGLWGLFLSGTTASSVTEFDIGCGYERLGTGTDA